MAKETHVLLVEDDFYARNWMELLLRRDWRTRVVGEVSNPVELSNAFISLNDQNGHADLVLIDTDHPNDPNWLPQVISSMAKHSPNSAILYTGVEPNLQNANLMAQPNFAGYILKNEIRYSIAWAVSLAAEHHIVITPGVRNLLERTKPLPSGTLILDGRKPIPFMGLSEIEEKRSRLVFFFSMERLEFADEERITEEYSNGLVSDLYNKIGLNDVLKGSVKPEDYFGNNPIVLAHINPAIKKVKLADEKSRQNSKKEKMVKVKEKESLAFHLLTLPVIEEIY